MIVGASVRLQYVLRLLIANEVMTLAPSFPYPVGCFLEQSVPVAGDRAD